MCVSMCVCRTVAGRKENRKGIYGQLTTYPTEARRRDMRRGLSTRSRTCGLRIAAAGSGRRCGGSSMLRKGFCLVLVVSKSDGFVLWWWWCDIWTDGVCFSSRCDTELGGRIVTMGDSHVEECNNQRCPAVLGSPFLAVDFYDICFFISFLLLPFPVSGSTFCSYHDKVLKYNMQHATTTWSSRQHNKTHWEGDRSQGPKMPFVIRPFTWRHQFIRASTRLPLVNSRSSHHFCAIGFG